VDPDIPPTPIEQAIERHRDRELERRRAEAVETALSGEHRIFLNDTAGPGTLAEALNRLVREGRVTAEFQDGDREDGEAQPHILYRPVG
jgi:hypothetical protein